MTAESRFEIQVNRNLEGIKFEKKGEIEKAIKDSMRKMLRKTLKEVIHTIDWRLYIEKEVNMRRKLEF